MTTQGNDDESVPTPLQEATTPAAEPDEGEVRERRAGRRALVVALVALGGLVLVVALALGGGALWLNSRVERFGDPFTSIPEAERPTRPAPVVPADRDPLNVLVLGSDSRISAGDPSDWQAGAQRTDAIMLVHLDGDREHASVMSIPRDSWVDVPGHGMAKINASYSYGGPALLVQTVETLTGVRIDHVAIADFDSFTELTDALGGVEITVGQDVYDSGGLGGLIVAKGTHVLDGKQALAYARQRYGLPGGDFDRVKRQQNWARAILTKAVSQGTLTDPAKATKFVTTVSGSVAVDDGLGLDDLVRLATELKGLRSSDVAFLTAPVAGTGWSPDGKQSIVNLDLELLAPLTEAIATDDVTRYLAEDPDAPELLGKDVR
ncbi:LCP family protein [Sanguibacter sp. HDW7]|uniref:LCP family protein n=1 Tax=Sanguibacter sp. HDW7 TaxID=2714931 RepID=UPI00140DFB23|nr:LCP family protein [Sanguibacter sp. HDW7]QIK84279.1 LytR family transcriptional regulator [Sanguibacter sp. HDW7]